MLTEGKKKDLLNSVPEIIIKRKINIFLLFSSIILTSATDWQTSISSTHYQMKTGTHDSTFNTLLIYNNTLVDTEKWAALRGTRAWLQYVTVWDVINGAPVSYLRIDGLEGRIVFVHLEVELGGGDGQGAFRHHGRSHQLRAGAEVYWAWRKRRTPVRETSRVSLLSNKWGNNAGFLPFL